MVEQSTTSPQPLSPEDERLWAMLAHLSVLLNLVSGFLGPVAAIVIFAVYKDRSRYVAFHALQSFWMQLVLWVGGGLLAGVIWFLSGLLSAVLIGLLCMPLACLFSFVPLVAIVYGLVGALQAYQGQDFRYVVFADWAEKMLG